MPTEDVRGWLQANLFDAVPVSICVIDRSFRVIVANELFGKTYGPWENRYCYSVYKDRSERCIHCGARETFNDGKIRSREEQGRTHDGRRIEYLVHLVPMVQPGGEVRHVIEMSTDISDLKRLEKEKTEAERLAAVGETVAGIAHGLKNVLMGLEGGMYAFSTGLDKGDAERMSQAWSMLQGNINRVSRFVREFLDFARGRAPDVSVVDPNEPARDVVDLFKEMAAKEGVTLEGNFHKGMAEAFLDREGIHTCLANLISNAIQACRMSDRKRKYKVTLSTREKNGSILYEVTDNGCGMDYDVSRKVFSSFFSTKSADSGTGLGLLTTKNIAHQHGGKVSFETDEGVGSVFRIELPRRNLPVPDADKETGAAQTNENA
jgi:signal transduction histidine kinase